MVKDIFRTFLFAHQSAEPVFRSNRGFVDHRYRLEVCQQGCGGGQRGRRPAECPAGSPGRPEVDQRGNRPIV